MAILPPCRLQLPGDPAAGVPGAAHQQVGRVDPHLLLQRLRAALPHLLHPRHHVIRLQRRSVKEKRDGGVTIHLISAILVYFRQPVLVRTAEAALPIPVRGVPLPTALRQHLLQPLLGLGRE